MRYPFERWIRAFGDSFNHTYHFAMFACCREAERKSYDFISKDQAKQLFEAEQDESEVTSVNLSKEEDEVDKFLETVRPELEEEAKQISTRGGHDALA